MRWLVGLLIVLCLAVFGGYIFVKGYPYQLYSNWVMGKGWNKYYSIPGYRSLLLKPIPLEPIHAYDEDYPQLWKDFPLRNSLVPLPTRHPMYQVLPIVELKKKQEAPQLGIQVETNNGKEISRVYSVPTALLPDFSLGQELFKLPFVRNRILRKNLDEVWKDVFTYEVIVRSKSLDEMIHDLYILHIRSRLLPKGTLRYGMNQEGKQAIIEVATADKDYQTEIIMTQASGSIYSFILRTDRQDPESMKLRSKFLQSVSFTPPDEAMGRILYTEFKQLNFARQVDQEGMLYLFTAWSQNLENPDFLREMIFYLERGRKNNRALGILYKYAFQRYGKTFTTRKLVGGDGDPEIELQRKIEVENLERAQAAEKAKVRVPVEPELSPDEKMNLYLKRAKESGPEDKKDMTIH